MAVHCPSCGGTDTVTGLADTIQCSLCGRLFDSKGEIVAPGSYDITPEGGYELTSARKIDVVGNLADLQRVGADDEPETAGAA